MHDSNFRCFKCSRIKCDRYSRLYTDAPNQIGGSGHDGTCASSSADKARFRRCGGFQMMPKRWDRLAACSVDAGVESPVISDWIFFFYKCSTITSNLDRISLLNASVRFQQVCQRARERGLNHSGTKGSQRNFLENLLLL
jgi:hypothetical protein